MVTKNNHSGAKTILQTSATASQHVSLFHCSVPVRQCHTTESHRRRWWQKAVMPVPSKRKKQGKPTSCKMKFKTRNRTRLHRKCFAAPTCLISLGPAFMMTGHNTTVVTPCKLHEQLTHAKQEGNASQNSIKMQKNRENQHLAK